MSCSRTMWMSPPPCVTVGFCPRLSRCPRLLPIFKSLLKSISIPMLSVLHPLSSCLMPSHCPGSRAAVPSTLDEDFPKLGELFRGPNNEDYNILGPILGSLFWETTKSLRVAVKEFSLGYYIGGNPIIYYIYPLW